MNQHFLAKLSQFMMCRERCVKFGVAIIVYEVVNGPFYLAHYVFILFFIRIRKLLLIRHRIKYLNEQI